MTIAAIAALGFRPSAVGDKASSGSGELSRAGGAQVRIQRSPGDIEFYAFWHAAYLRESSQETGHSTVIAELIAGRCRKALGASRRFGEIVEVRAISNRAIVGVRGRWSESMGEKAIGAFGECLVEPQFSQGEVKRIAAAQRAMRLREAQTPRLQALALFRRALFGASHPYARSTLGSAESLRNLHARSVQRTFQSLYPIGGLRVSLSGDVPDSAESKLRARLVGDALPTAVAELPVAPTRELYASSGAARSTHVVWGALLPNQPQHVAAALVWVRYVEQRLSRLAREAKHEAVVSAHVDVAQGKGYWAIYMRSEPRAAGPVLALLQRELAAAARQEVAVSELEIVLEQFRAGQDRNDEVQWALRAVGLGEPLHLDSSSVLAVAPHLFASGDAVLASLGPPLYSPGARKRSKGRVRKGKGARR